MPDAHVLSEGDRHRLSRCQTYLVPFVISSSPSTLCNASFSLLPRTHRHPVSAVPSMCSLVKAMHSVYYEMETRDDAALGHEIASLSERLLADSPKNMKECGLEYADVLYHELVDDPLNTVKSLYKQFGWEFTAEYEAIITE